MDTLALDYLLRLAALAIAFVAFATIVVTLRRGLGGDLSALQVRVAFQFAPHSSLEPARRAADAVLLLGPLYHLTDEKDRLEALREARRVLKSGGVLLAVGISRFASTFDGLRKGFLKDPQFADIVNQDLKNGQHRNPANHPEYFMDTFFHHPDELRKEVAEAGFVVTGIYGVEGPCWLLPDFAEWWDHMEYRERLLRIARTLETEPSILGVSAHLVAVAEK
jgi:SAM-dependent methyltransferase